VKTTPATFCNQTAKHTQTAAVN